MKLTNREKVMLCILVIVALIAVAYYLVIQPQADKIAMYSQKNEELSQKVQSVKQELAAIDGLKAEIGKLNQELQKKTERFYPAIYQDRFIVLFNSLISETGVKCSGISFSEPSLLELKTKKAQPEQQYPLKDLADSYKAINGTSADNSDKSTGEQNAAPKTADTQKAGAQTSNKQGTQKEETLKPASETMSVTLQISASYTNWMSFLKKVEALNRTVIVQNLVLADANTGMISGSVMVNIYAIPKLQDADKEYLEWPFKGIYGRSNPFAAFASFPNTAVNQANK